MVVRYGMFSDKKNILATLVAIFLKNGYFYKKNPSFCAFIPDSITFY